MAEPDPALLPLDHPTPPHLEEAFNNLVASVEDWKGHNANHFGPLLWHGRCKVTGSRQPHRVKTYELYIFARIFLALRQTTRTVATRVTKYEGCKCLTAALESQTVLKLRGRIYFANVIGVTKAPSGRVLIRWVSDEAIEDLELWSDEDDAVTEKCYELIEDGARRSASFRDALWARKYYHNNTELHDLNVELLESWVWVDDDADGLDGS